jgi:type 1 fimbria pilin
MKNNYSILKIRGFKLLRTSLIALTILFIVNKINAKPVCQESDDDKYNKGITVSPSHLNFNVDIGKMETKKIKVSNYTGTTQKFSVKYNDFDMTQEGKSTFMDAATSKYSLSKLVNIVPTFIELEAGKTAEITVTVQVPNDPEANKSAWGILLLEQTEEKKVLDPGNTSGQTIAFGITPTYAFGVWLYQNPPNVESMNVDIENFSYKKVDDTQRILTLSVENKGDGISFCKAYVEMTNTKTGSQMSLGGKNYTILPGYNRTFMFELPADIPKGSYSAVGVLDYNSDEEVVAAELEITVE